MKRFALYRHEDETGISGTGIVAEGVQFSTGTVVLQWTTGIPSVVIYNDIESVQKIHGHEGKTSVYWLENRAK